MNKPSRESSSPPQYDETGAKPITSRTLRGLGEKADATRDAHLALVRRIGLTDESRYDVLPVEEAQKLQAARRAEIIDHVITPSTMPSRQWMSVNVSVRGRPVDIPADADAAFWSESAVEKLLWPYYEGMRIWDEDYLPRLKAALRDTAVVGLVHVGESRGLTVTDGPARIVINDSDRLTGNDVLTLDEFEEYQRSR